MMKSVLIIEDNKLILENSAELLELEQFRVLKACNGQEGLEMALKNKPDLIICDIMMPEINGFDLIKILKQEASLKNIPFIFFTASAEKSEIKRGLDAGANDYIVKPFDTDNLIELVRKYIGK